MLLPYGSFIITDEEEEDVIIIISSFCFLCFYVSISK